MLTASIVLYNTPRYQFDKAIESILNSGCCELLYVIDNSSNDSRRIIEKRSPSIRYIHSANLGYGAGHNLALHEAIDAGSDYHVVINPDIYFEPSVLCSLVQFMESHLDAAYVLPRVVYPNGELQYLCKLLPTPLDLFLRRFLPFASLKSNERYELRMSGYDKIINPPCLSGCFMFMRMSVLKKYNLFFDEKYFMYCEDFDLIRRIHRVAKTLYYPDVCIVHEHAKESYKNKKMFWIHLKSAFRYFNKFGWFFDKERKEMNKEILRELG